jgi:hypothetical protein
MKMTNTDFERWLRQGRGKAAAYIQSEDQSRYQDALLHGCTHNLCYDRQCEETRGYYLANLVRMSGHWKFFRDGVLAALTSGGRAYESDDVLQMFAVARHWAEAGDVAVRRTLYEVFDRDAFERAEIWCGEYLVRMDGLDALLFVMQLFGRIGEGDRLRHFESLLAELEERDGKEASTVALAAAAVNRPDLAQLLDMLRAEKDRRTLAEREWEAMPRRDYASVKRGIMGEENRAKSLMNWGKEATDEELQSAAQDLLSESDENRLWEYLRIFRDRHFPGPPARLIELARCGSWRLSHAAAAALTNIADPALRTLGLELMNTPDRCDLGVTLLSRWCQPGDYGLVEQVLRRPMSDHIYHSVELDVLGFVKANLTGDAEACLKLLYDDGPCSTCRESCVKHLIALDRFPDWMRDECLHDADSGTRELAAGRADQE